MAVQIQVRRSPAARWTSINPTLAAGEIGFESDTKYLKIGDGSTAWTGLSYVAGPIDAANITSGTLAVARGGTGSATAPMVGVITAADAAAARTVLGLGTAATVSTGTSAGNAVVLDGSARLPAVDGSQLTNISGGGGSNTDHKSAPITSTWRFFDDMFQMVPDSGSNDGNNQFWMMQGGSGITAAEAVFADARGVVQLTLGGSNRRHTYWGGMILSGLNKADGDELFWESRFKFVDSTATSGSVQLGVVDRVNTLNKGDSAPSTAYSSFDFAAIVLSLSETNLVISHKDTGSADTPTKVDLGSSFPITSYVDSFIRLGVHAKYNATDTDWDIDFYVNGTKVSSTISMTFDDALVPYIGTSVSTHTGNANLNLDWISYQGKIGSQISGRTTLVDIDSV